MTTLNKKALVFLLRERLGKDAVQDPTDIESNKNDYLIKKKKLLKLFKVNDKYIDTIIENISKKFKNMIYLDDFINFLRYDAASLNKTKYTQGTYHIYMDYIHALYNIKCNNFIDKDNDQMGLPTYNNIISDQPLYKAILPARKEFIFAWWMMNIIRKNYSKYIDIEVEFQTRIEGKIFDIYIKSCDLIIEYQEAKANHTDVDTDKDKKAIIRGQGMIIEYFQECMFNEHQEQYLNDFWKNQLEKRIIQTLIRNRKNNDFLDYYVFNKFKETYHEERIKLKKSSNDSYVKDRIYQLNSLLNESNITIKKIFTWKHAKNDMIISVDDIAELIKIKTKIGKKDMEEILKKLVVANIKNKAIYTNWNGLITFLLMVNDEIHIDPVVKRNVIDYLLSVQSIYENIMDELDLFHKSLITNIIDNSQRREDYIQNTIEKKYNNTIIKLNINKKEQNKVINDYMAQTKNIIKSTSKITNVTKDIKHELDNIENTQVTKKILTKISKIREKLDKHEDDINKYYADINIIKPKESYTISDNLTINKPIIDNIPQIIYTGNIKNIVEIEAIKSFFIRRKIPVTTLKLLTNALAPYSKNPKIFTKLKLKDELLKCSDDETSDEDNSDVETSDEDNSDDDNNTEDDDNSDDDNNTEYEDNSDEDNNKNTDNNKDTDEDNSDEDNSDDSNDEYITNYTPLNIDD